jgi:hypothetical protein
VGAVDQPVEDGVGECRVPNVLMPVFEGELAGDHGCSGAVAVLQNLEQVTAFRIGERGESPVVEDQKFGLRQLLQQFRVRSVGAGEGELGEKAPQPEIASGEAVSAGGLTEGTGQIALTDSSRARDALPINSLSESFTAGIR